VIESEATPGSALTIWTYHGNAASVLGALSYRIQPCLWAPSNANSPATPDELVDFEGDGSVELCVDTAIFRTEPAFSIGLPLLVPTSNAPPASMRLIGDMNLDGYPDVVVGSSAMVVPVNSYPIQLGCALNLSRRAPACGASSTFGIGMPNPGNPGFAF